MTEGQDLFWSHHQGADVLASVLESTDTYSVAQQVSLDLAGGGARSQTSHHCDQLLGFDLPFALAVKQRETLLKICNNNNNNNNTAQL